MLLPVEKNVLKAALKTIPMWSYIPSQNREDTTEDSDSNLKIHQTE